MTTAPAPAIIEQVEQWLSSELADAPATPRVFVLATRFGAIAQAPGSAGEPTP